MTTADPTDESIVSHAQPRHIKTQLITAATHASLNAEKPFPQIIGMLSEADVEFYHVDYLALRKTFYNCEGAVVSIPIPLEVLPQVAADFDFKAHRDKHSRQPAKRSVVARLHNAKRR